MLLSTVGNAVQLMGDGEGTTAAMATCRANIASSNTFTGISGPGAFITNTAWQAQFQQLLTSGTLGSCTIDTMGWRDLRVGQESIYAPANIISAIPAVPVIQLFLSKTTFHDFRKA